jgi:hypothetical protein
LPGGIDFSIDDDLIEEAQRLGEHNTAEEAVRAALQEYVCWRKQLGILKAFGTVDFDPRYDYKAERQAKTPVILLSNSVLSLHSENFGGEGFNGRTLLPCVQRQAGFAAGLLEKGSAVPVALGWHLRQKQAATPGHGDQQAVASDLDGVDRNGLRRRQDAKFDFQLRRFPQRDGMEARVFKRGSARGVCDRTIDRAHGKHITYASPQFTMQV